jgi:hypothetical protein
MSDIVRILIERDGMCQSDAEEEVRKARMQVRLGADPAEVLEEEFGLEPDYIFDLI